jgi:Ni,Fe-hydrogenase maturation factor
MAGDLPIQKQKIMTEQQEKLISIEYLLDIIEDLLNDKYPYDLSILKQISINAKAKHQKELSEAIEEGFDEGVKHINQLIMSDEKFPF